MQYKVNHQRTNRAQIVLDRSEESGSHLALSSEQIDLASNRFLNPDRPRLDRFILPRHDPMPGPYGEKDAYIYQEIPCHGPRQYLPHKANLEHHHFQPMNRPPPRRHNRPHHHGPPQFQNHQYPQQRFFPQPRFPQPRFRSFPPRGRYFQENHHNRNHIDPRERNFSRQRDLQLNAQRDYQPRKNETPSMGSSHSSLVFHNSTSPKGTFPAPPSPKKNFPKPPTPITPLEKSLRKKRGYSQFYKTPDQTDDVKPSEAVAEPLESLVDEHEDSVPIVPVTSESVVEASIPSQVLSPIPRSKSSSSRSPKENDAKRSKSIPTLVLSPISRNKSSSSRSPKENDPKRNKSSSSRSPKENHQKRSTSFHTASEFSQSLDSFKTATSFGSAAGSILDFDNCVDDDQLKRKQWKREFTIRNNSDKLTEVLSVMEQLQNNDTPLEEIRPENSDSLSPDAVLEKMNKFQDDSTLE